MCSNWREKDTPPREPIESIPLTHLGMSYMAAKNLVIVESPAKAKTLEKYLGRDFQVKASVGHVVDLPKSKLGVDVEKNFAPEYSHFIQEKGHRRA